MIDLTKKYKDKGMEKAYVVDIAVNCNCFEGTEEECKAEIEDLVNNYGHDRSRYAISFNRFD